MKIFAIILLLGLIHPKLYSQDKGQIEFRSGVVFWDLITEPGDVLKSRQGWGSQIDLTYIRTIDLSERLKLLGGIGYTNFYFWDADLIDLSPAIRPVGGSFEINDIVITSNYANLKYGLCYEFKKKYLSTSAIFSHYILAQPLQGRNQRRMFLNLDLGVEFRISPKSVFKIFSPITIHPIIEDGVFRILSPGVNPPVNRFVEMNGLLLGLGFDLN